MKLVNWFRKSLALVGVVLGLSVALSTAANASDLKKWDFSYTTNSGITLSAFFWAALNPQGFWDVKNGTVWGDRDGVSILDIECHYCQQTDPPGSGTNYGDTDNYFLPGNQAEFSFYLANGEEYAFQYLSPYGYANTEWRVTTDPGVPFTTNLPDTYGISYPWTAACTPNGLNCLQTGEPTFTYIGECGECVHAPEIDASASAAALAALASFGLMMRELFARRRRRADAPGFI